MRREKTVRGQYTAGFARGSSSCYLEEEGANKSSNTETFVAIRVDIDDCAGRARRSTCAPGKRLPAKCSEVVVYFKNPELNPFSENPAGTAAEQADHPSATGRGCGYSYS
ncbi:hypothetical protein ACNKHS_11000 [Shigella flexneri]